MLPFIRTSEFCVIICLVSTMMCIWNLGNKLCKQKLLSLFRKKHHKCGWRRVSNWKHFADICLWVLDIFQTFVTTQSTRYINNENLLSKGYTTIVKCPTVNIPFVKYPAVNLCGLLSHLWLGSHQRPPRNSACSLNRKLELEDWFHQLPWNCGHSEEAGHYDIALNLSVLDFFIWDTCFWVFHPNPLKWHHFRLECPDSTRYTNYSNTFFFSKRDFSVFSKLHLYLHSAVLHA